MLFLHPIDSGDLFHHLNTGRYITEKKQLPKYDNLTFTAYGKPWVAYAWGSGLVYYKTYNLFQYAGISTLIALLGVTASYFLFQTLIKLNLNPVISGTFTLFAASIASLRWPSRPEIMAAVFTSILIYYLTNAKKCLKFTPLLFFLWGIIYGSSAFLGIIIFLFWIIATNTLNKKTLSLFALSMIAAFLNGYGLSGFLYVFQIPKIGPRIGEWLPLLTTINKDLAVLAFSYQYIVLAYLIFTAIYTITIVTAIFKKHTVVYKNLFYFGISISIFAAFYMNRFINLTPFLAIPALAIIWIEINTLMKRIMFISILLVILLSAYLKLSQFSFELDLTDWPFQKKIIRYMKNNDLNGNVFSSQEIGSFLSWNLPNSKVFVDTRDDLFTQTSVLSDLDLLANKKINILEILDKHGANIIVGRTASGTIYKPVFYSNSWVLTFITDGYFIAVRKNSFPNIKNGISAVDITTNPPAKPGELDQAETEVTELIRLDNETLTNKLMLIEIKLAKGEPNEARSIFDSIKSDESLQLSDLSARIYLSQNDCHNAKKSLGEIEAFIKKHKFIFYPTLKFPTEIARYSIEYQKKCKSLN